MTNGSFFATTRQQVFIGVSLLLFLLACVTPCLEMSQKSDPVWYGLRILVLGWMGFLAGQFAWYANPLWLIGLCLLAFRKWSAAAIFSGLSLLFALNTLLMFVMPLPADESKVNTTSLMGLRIGFYFWMASLAVPFVKACVMRNQLRLQPRIPVRPHTTYTH
jgi:hypothetical protein